MVNRLLHRGTVANCRVAIVDTQWNDFIVSRLTEGAIDALRRGGVDDDSIDHITVPGAFEVPVMVRKLCGTGRYDAVVALGCVIRGATPHFDFVAGEAVRGLSSAMAATGVPVTFGILTTDTIEQAIERAGTKLGNKGVEAASVALEMIGLLRVADVGVEGEKT